ncbi:MAG: NAD(P)-binding protein [Candidatus Odinarchaeota archaeon]
MPEELSSFSNQPAVIGSGLGGLLIGALLAKNGFKPLIFEKLAFAGGRFTSHNYQGYAVPTGAVHMLPFGVKGSVAKIIRDELDLNIALHPTDRFTSWLWPNEQKERYHQKFLAAVKVLPSLRDRWKLAKLITGRNKFEKAVSPLSVFLDENGAGLRLVEFFKAIAGFALSLNLDEILAKDMYHFLEKQFHLGRPAIPAGGCRAVTERLVGYIGSHGGKIFLKSPVTEINAEEEENNRFRITNLVINLNGEEELEFQPEFVISNAGQKLTAELSRGPGFLSAGNDGFQPAAGFGLVFGLEKPLLGHTGITLTPGNENLCGVIEPSHADPSLAPSGHHLFISHHPLVPGLSLERNIKLGREEIHSTFPRLDKVGTELAVHSFHSDWPVNRVRQGSSLPGKEETCNNLFFVGDGNRSLGDIMTEGVAGGVLKVINLIEQNGYNTCLEQSRFEIPATRELS